MGNEKEVDAESEWPDRVKDPEGFERKRQEAIAATERALLPVRVELARSGIVFERWDDLRDPKVDVRNAVPILLEWLPLVVEPKAKVVIAYILIGRRPKGVPLDVVVKEFERTPESAPRDLKWVLGYVIAQLADRRHTGEIVRLVENPEHGKGRETLLLALGRLRPPRAFEILISFLDQPVLFNYAIEGLGNLKDERARPYLEPFLSHQDSYTRQKAKAALAKLDRAAVRRKD